MTSRDTEHIFYSVFWDLYAIDFEVALEIASKGLRVTAAEVEDAAIHSYEDDAPHYELSVANFKREINRMLYKSIPKPRLD